MYDQLAGVENTRLDGGRTLYCGILRAAIAQGRWRWRRVRIGVAVVLLFFAAVLGGFWIRSYSWVTNWQLVTEDQRLYQFTSKPGSIRFRTEGPESPTVDEWVSCFNEYHKSEPRFLTWMIAPGRNPQPPSMFKFSVNAPLDPGLVVRFPYWFAVLVCVVLAAALGLRRPKQYSLRAFFLVVTLMAHCWGQCSW